MAKYNEKEIQEGSESLLSSPTELNDGTNNGTATEQNADLIGSMNGGSKVLKRAAGPCAALFIMAFIGALIERNLMDDVHVSLDPSSSSNNSILDASSMPLPVANNVAPSLSTLSTMNAPVTSTVDFVPMQQEGANNMSTENTSFLRGSEGSGKVEEFVTTDAYQAFLENSPIGEDISSRMHNNGLLYEATANVNSPFDKTKEIPIYWKLLRTGNVSILPYLTDCLNMVTASEVGVTLDENINDEANMEAYAELTSSDVNFIPTSQALPSSSTLQIVTLPSERRYVNVDTSTQQGLINAKDMNLVGSGLVDVVISPLFQESVHTLYDENVVANGHKARLFTMLRHPVDRAVSMYYFLKSNAMESDNRAWINDMSLMDYVNSGYAESNRVVRGLINKKSEMLTRDDLEYAQALLKEKFLVGLTSQLSESLERIRIYYGYTNDEPHMRSNVPQTAAQCKEHYIQQEHVDRHHLDHPTVVEGSQEWEMIRRLNWADVALYEYVSNVLYAEQGKMFPSLANLSNA